MSSQPLFSDLQFQSQPFTRIEYLEILTVEQETWFSFLFKPVGEDRFAAELERFKGQVIPPDRRWNAEKKRWLVHARATVELCRLFPDFVKQIEGLGYPAPDLSEEETGGDPWAEEA